MLLDRDVRDLPFPAHFPLRWLPEIFFIKPPNWRHTPNFSLIPDVRSPLVIQLVPFRKYGLSVRYLQVPVLLGFLIHVDILFLNSLKSCIKITPLQVIQVYAELVALISEDM